jgi:hypothetical protein
MTEEVYRDFKFFNMAPFCSHYGSYNVQSRDGGWIKMADTCVLGPIAGIEMATEVGKEISRKDVPLC